MNYNSGDVTIDQLTATMNKLEAAIVLSIGLGEYAIKPLAKTALYLLELYERKFDSTNYVQDWYRQEHRRLDDLPYSTVEAALQKNWQILWDHLNKYRQSNGVE